MKEFNGQESEARFFGVRKARCMFFVAQMEKHRSTEH